MDTKANATIDEVFEALRDGRKAWAMCYNDGDGMSRIKLYTYSDGSGRCSVQWCDGDGFVPITDRGRRYMIEIPNPRPEITFDTVLTTDMELLFSKNGWESNVNYCGETPRSYFSKNFGIFYNPKISIRYAGHPETCVTLQKIVRSQCNCGYHVASANFCHQCGVKL